MCQLKHQSCKCGYIQLLAYQARNTVHSGACRGRTKTTAEHRPPQVTIGHHTTGHQHLIQARPVMEVCHTIVLAWQAGPPIQAHLLYRNPRPTKFVVYRTHYQETDRAGCGTDDVPTPPAPTSLAHCQWRGRGWQRATEGGRGRVGEALCRTRRKSFVLSGLPGLLGCIRSLVKPLTQ